MPRRKTYTGNLDDDPVIVDLRERVTRLETDFKWMKRCLERIERRTWQILGSVVAFGVISILIALMS